MLRCCQRCQRHYVVDAALMERRYCAMLMLSTPPLSPAILMIDATIFLTLLRRRRVAAASAVYLLRAAFDTRH